MSQEDAKAAYAAKLKEVRSSCNLSLPSLSNTATLQVLEGSDSDESKQYLKEVRVCSLRFILD